MPNFKEDHMFAERNSRDKHSGNTFNIVRSTRAAVAPRRLWMAFLGLCAVSATSQASTLSINNNVITLDGELSATVTHTAQGMAIDIPGVEITLDCPTTDACTVSIGSAATASGYGSGATNTAGSGTGASTGDSSGGSSNTGTAGGTTGGTAGDTGSNTTDTTGSSTSGSSGDGALDLNELCASPRPTDLGFRQTTWDKYCPGYTPTDTSGGTGGTGGGSTVGGNNDSDGSDDCPGVGYDCYNHGGSGGTTNDVVSNAVAFPTGGSRRVENNASQTDFGSAGRNAAGGTVYVDIDKGSVVVAGMTMSSEQRPALGRLSFGVTAKQVVGADLRAWISKDPDGGRISNACSYVGYAEAALRFSMDGSRDCNLERGGSYFVNAALCKSDRDDWDCRSAGAMTAEENATLVFEVKYD